MVLFRAGDGGCVMHSHGVLDNVPRPEMAGSDGGEEGGESGGDEGREVGGKK